MFLVGGSIFIGCQKNNHSSPNLNFKTGQGYLSSDATASINQTIKVGVIADKVEDDMNTYTVAYSYDNNVGSVTSQAFALTGAEQQHFEKDITFNTRNVSGTEKWIFTITDKKGNIAQKQIILTVY